ncbi:VrlE [Myxococcus llanfairpwllgwyngyllgogerychwyrndrobwllllantysiliogogogochensis]|uniref:VrlE n=1 Tax=Myxococcus llanfairpwllgwyngyllgogerychwyrndrobwllllantysiliogogogochensis TaxID=2590453 RepID=A0A540WPV6_9BACT|nr:amidoligase family protein [Myxococcus llanfairpwllgwyngyllgogerychwyrndrobwllllantysiliogogogochensis]TQF11038.1 VrlE [Myxococcus llanfairpwllgwyngyllgogerychwyrndrobwllllantysiliogogogochensis]
MKTLRFGIEIETVGASRQKLAHAIQGAVGGRVSGDYQGWQVTDSQGRTWKVVPDGSLSGGEYSGEIVSPILTYQDLEALQQVVRATREAGARADATCGIHIHVDGSRFEPKGVTNLVKMVHKQERLLETALGVSAARLSRFCKPIDGAFLQRLEARRPRTMQEVNEAWYGRRNPTPARYDSSRYHGLNLNSLFFRGTIEFRYFNGSLHAGEVKSYVQLVLALAARALASKAASSKRRDFNPATAKYDFRVFLLHLGLIGEEFKTARLHLLKKLEGSAAWKGQRRDRRGSGGEEDGSPGSEGPQGAQGGAGGNTPTEALNAA